MGSVMGDRHQDQTDIHLEQTRALRPLAVDRIGFGGFFRLLYFARFNVDVVDVRCAGPYP